MNLNDDDLIEALELVLEELRQRKVKNLIIEFKNKSEPMTCKELIKQYKEKKKGKYNE